MKIDPRIKKVLFTAKEIELGIQRAAEYLNTTYHNQSEPVILLGILKGCVTFLGQLLPKLTINLELDFLLASSYVKTASSGVVKIIADMQSNVYNRDVVVIEDIIDTAQTLQTVVGMLKERKARSVKTVTLLDKQKTRKVDLTVDFASFKVEPVFVVGFGFDYNEQFRNLPYIGILKEEVYQK